MGCASAGFAWLLSEFPCSTCDVRLVWISVGCGTRGRCCSTVCTLASCRNTPCINTPCLVASTQRRSLCLLCCWLYQHVTFSFRSCVAVQFGCSQCWCGREVLSQGLEKFLQRFLACSLLHPCFWPSDFQQCFDDGQVHALHVFQYVKVLSAIR